MVALRDDLCHPPDSEHLQLPGEALSAVLVRGDGFGCGDEGLHGAW